MASQGKGLICALVLGCTWASFMTLPAQAGDGQIIIQREVHGRMATRQSLVPDPNPLTVNANASARITSATSHELSDADFAGITTGASVNRMVSPNGAMRVLTGENTSVSGPGRGGSGAGSGGGTGGIAGTITNAVSRGMSPLQTLGGR